MLDRLAEIETKYEDLAEQINDPDVIANQTEWRKRMKACFKFTPSEVAPHLAETTSPPGSVSFAKLSKRELDFVLFFLLPCGAKPSALVL